MYELSKAAQSDYFDQRTTGLVNFYPMFLTESRNTSEISVVEYKQSPNAHNADGLDFAIVK